MAPVDELDQTARRAQRAGTHGRAGYPDRTRRALTGIAMALAELRDMAAPEQVYDAAVRATVEHCGFDRAILFEVVGDELVAQSVHFGGDAAWAARTLALGQRCGGRPQLSDFIVETELVRRRATALVPDAQHNARTPRALVEETETRSYVAAPIICEDRVIGFLHADQFFKSADVDAVDREVLAAFAVGLGLILERKFVRRQLLRQRMRLTAISREISTVAYEAGLVDPHAGPLPSRDSEARHVRDALTVREREVIELLVGGSTNAVIARRLYITESTAKAHVHHILKKLGAANRAEAVAKFLRGV